MRCSAVFRLVLMHHRIASGESPAVVIICWVDFRAIEDNHAWQAEWELLANLVSLHGFWYELFFIQSTDCRTV